MNLNHIWSCFRVSAITEEVTILSYHFIAGNRTQVVERWTLFEACCNKFDKLCWEKLDQQLRSLFYPVGENIWTWCWISWSVVFIFTDWHDKCCTNCNICYKLCSSNIAILQSRVHFVGCLHQEMITEFDIAPHELSWLGRSGREEMSCGCCCCVIWFQK